MTNNYGEGLVLDGYDLQAAFEKLQVEKDLETGDAPVLWTHRTIPGMEIYFITNQSDQEIDLEPSFRVTGLKPQLWNAVTGEIRHLVDFTEFDGRTVVPLKMEGQRSWFVVFTNASTNEIKAAYKNNLPELKPIKEIEGPFVVDFQNKEIGPKDPVVFDQLTDWSKFDNENIKFYSGTATYKRTFSIDELAADHEYFINLGDVRVMAEVKMNGEELGGVWIAPYRLNITSALKQGENQLEIEVVNLWRNRLIKDKMLPEDEKYTWLVVEDIKKDEQPHSSGLIGPVQIEEIK